VSLAAVIAARRAEHGIAHAVSCRAPGVSQAWFYKWVCVGTIPFRPTDFICGEYSNSSKINLTAAMDSLKIEPVRSCEL